MKALTLWQPWASAVALKLKRYETRSWSTAYRGPVVIHAAQTQSGLEQLRQPQFASLRQVELPFGAAVAVAELTDVIPIGQYALLPEKQIPSEQIPFGDYAPGRFAWRLENISPLSYPISEIGQQGFWDWPLKPLFTYAGLSPEMLAALARKFHALVVGIDSHACDKGLIGKYIPELGSENAREFDAGLRKLLEILLQRAVILFCASQGHQNVVAQAAQERYQAVIHRL